MGVGERVARLLFGLAPLVHQGIQVPLLVEGHSRGASILGSLEGAIQMVGGFGMGLHAGGGVREDGDEATTTDHSSEGHGEVVVSEHLMNDTVQNKESCPLGRTKGCWSFARHGQTAASADEPRNASCRRAMAQTVASPLRCEVGMLTLYNKRVSEESMPAVPRASSQVEAAHAALVRQAATQRCRVSGTRHVSKLESEILTRRALEETFEGGRLG